MRRERLGRGGEMTANSVARMRGRCLAGREGEDARHPVVVGIRQQLLGSRFCASRMSILRVATAPVLERARSIWDNWAAPVPCSTQRCQSHLRCGQCGIPLYPEEGNELAARWLFDVLSSPMAGQQMWWIDRLAYSHYVHTL